MALMLLLTFRAAENLYAIDVTRVVEVVPRINLRRLPHAPSFLAGVFDYRGTVVPVIDLGVLLGSESCRDRLSTRTILVNSHPAAVSQPEQLVDAAEIDQEVTAATGAIPPAVQPREHGRWLLGLIAEQVSDVSSIMPEQVISLPIQLPQTPYLGAIVQIDHEMVQLIAVDKVLEDTLRRSFFGTPAAEDREPLSTSNTQTESM
jgi:chemotaxis-related protein WspB